MKNFKPGQKVVFDTKGLKIFSNESIGAARLPQNGDIVTIFRYDGKRQKEHMWLVSEYLKNKDGIIQAFAECFLFPLEEAHAAQSEKIIADLEKKIQETFEPVEA